MKIAVLDNVRSVYNVGSIFRTANAAGIEKIYLCGITPTPLDKKGRRRSDFTKVALGAEDVVAWEFMEKTEECLEVLKKDGTFVIAIEQDERAVDYKKVSIEGKGKIAFVIGAEIDGMKTATLSLCDVVAEIPMLGTKESLNVTIAFGIAIYRILGI
jgi:23S rRNA (guanosine2251-2'-O)-methyltransferase